MLAAVVGGGDLEVPLLRQIFNHFACFKAQLHLLQSPRVQNLLGAPECNSLCSSVFASLRIRLLGAAKISWAQLSTCFPASSVLTIPSSLFLSLRVDALHYAKSPVTAIFLVRER